MPSPVGHVLGGVICGCLVEALGQRRSAPAGERPGPAAAGAPSAAGRARSTIHLRGPIGRALVYGALGILPDVDFLVSAHNMYTHSVGAMLAIGLAAAVVYRAGGLTGAPAAAAAYGSHILLDWLGSDATPPLGIMALWPFSDGFYLSDRRWFMAISRRYFLPGFWAHNLYAVAWELILLGPLAALAVWWRYVRGLRTQD